MATPTTPERQLIDAIGVVEIGDRTIDGRRDHGGDAGYSLCVMPPAMTPGTPRRISRFDVGRQLRQPEPHAHVGAAAGDVEQKELQQRPPRHTPQTSA